MDFSNPDTIRQAFGHQEQRIATLEAQLSSLLASRQPSRPRAILPDPEKFSGATRYDTWLPLIKAKLDIDSEAIGGSDKAHFWYVYGNLDSKIQALVLPLASETQLKPSLIFDSLARIYEDPNKASRASDRLTQLRQGTDSLPHFLAKFERTLFEAQALDWPDSAKISTLRAGLNDHLKRKLEVQLAVPAKYDDFVRALHQLSGHAKSVGFAPAAATASTNHHDKMEIGAISTIGAITTTTVPRRGLDWSCIPATELSEEDNEED
jgi:hypothetical protein